jgi:hypothetical protein
MRIEPFDPPALEHAEQPRIQALGQLGELPRPRRLDVPGADAALDLRVVLHAADDVGDTLGRANPALAAAFDMRPQTAPLPRGALWRRGYSVVHGLPSRIRQGRAD